MAMDSLIRLALTVPTPRGDRTPRGRVLWTRRVLASAHEPRSVVPSSPDLHPKDTPPAP